MSGSKAKRAIIDPLETGIESVHSIGKKATRHFADEAGKSGQTFLSQLLGLEKKSKASHSENSPKAKESNISTGGVIELVSFLTHADSPKAEKAPRRAEAAMDYHRDMIKSSERASSSEMREMNHNIQQIKAELAKLVASSHELKLKFADVGVDMATPTVGQYHLNFFEWMLAVIRSARAKVEDSGAWLGTVKGKGAKKGYWGMFKKHGTTFGMSGERSVATQVG